MILDDWTCDSTMQERLVTGTVFVHETCGSYKSVEELWDGETSDAWFSDDRNGVHALMLSLLYRW